MVKYLFLISFISASESLFLTKSLALGILFSAVVSAVVVAKLEILSISFLASFILASREATLGIPF